MKHGGRKCGKGDRSNRGFYEGKYLRDDERIPRQRQEWYRMYCEGELSLEAGGASVDDAVAKFRADGISEDQEEEKSRNPCLSLIRVDGQIFRPTLTSDIQLLLFEVEK